MKGMVFRMRLIMIRLLVIGGMGADLEKLGIKKIITLLLSNLISRYRKTQTITLLFSQLMFSASLFSLNNER